MPDLTQDAISPRWNSGSAALWRATSSPTRSVDLRHRREQVVVAFRSPRSPPHICPQ
jgi:hypothetical protein